MDVHWELLLGTLLPYTLAKGWARLGLSLTGIGTIWTCMIGRGGRLCQEGAQQGKGSPLG